MTVTVSFDYKTKHTVEVDGNQHVVARAAIPASPGLYVIRNKAQAAHVYAGTSSNLKQRFNARFEVFRETGFVTADLAGLRIYIIKILINGASRAVNDNGIILVNGVAFDVENLLIRSIVAVKHCNVLNVAKWQTFSNPFNEQLDVNFLNFPHSTAYFVPGNFYMAAHHVL
ncbi:hypothetical protein B0E47_00045 [Rhodanobacter sp. B05]|uniref:hypothetical protein n=1 Tax=Rhodanobacter sp. B05 TaxID=1945859 RepID=UPI00098680D8|nr:hypothetical protein [Rhodanobacter sp. B05]OOG61107.1 hypothetical protein B0E47_00045 [Rhodanobacter sp. B05]